MKSTNNSQTTEDMNKKAIAPTWQSCIVEELSDEAASALRGGGRRYTASEIDPATSYQLLSSATGGSLGG
jgi:hypothetical protein